MSLIIYGHPRSRTNFLCSHIRGFPKELFDLTKVNSDLQLDWSLNLDPRESVYSDRASLYLQKIKSENPEYFKIFGFHLQNWPACFAYIQSLNYPVIRVYRKNKFEAILSLLLGQRRGWTSNTQSNISAFDVSFGHFSKAFSTVVTHDQYWESKFQFDVELEYNELPSAVMDGALQKYGVEKNQIYKLENQDSITLSQSLIKNIKELEQWNELMYKEKY